jgi:hypothetical protein
MTVFELAREANVILGPAAFCALGYRAVIGLSRRQIAYRWLFILFVYYVGIAAMGAPTGIALGRSATYLSPLLTLGHVALICTCIWMPGPLTKEDPNDR